MMEWWEKEDEELCLSVETDFRHEKDIFLCTRSPTKDAIHI